MESRHSDEHQPRFVRSRLLQSLPVGALPHYERLNLAVTPDTRPAYTDANVIRPPTELGSGAFNTVYSVQLRNARGADVEGVFKPLRSKETGWVAIQTGIPHRNPQLAMRNIATAAYAQKLGFDVIANTKIALLTVPRAAAKPPAPRLGLLMEHAPGKTAAETDLTILARPDVAREVTKLQLLDHLTGQGDRHSRNYFVHIGADQRAKVTGIDNDQCFGEKAFSPEAIRYEKTPERKGFRGTRLPPVVDHEMAIAINDLAPSDLRNMLVDKLSTGEINAAIQRLEGVKQHIAKLDMQGLVVSPDEWSHPNVQRALSSDNSYAQREISRGLRRAGNPPAQAPW